MKPRGFTLIELLVVISVVALLFGVGLDRLLRYQELAERTAMELNVSAMNVALTMKFASLVAAGRGEAIQADAGANPVVTLLARPPENYLGELYSPEIGTLARPSWYYDRQSSELVYVPSRGRHLTSSSGRIDRLRFRVLFTEISSQPGAPKELRQPYVGPVAPYQWVIE